MKKYNERYSVYVDGREVASTDCAGTAMFIAISSNGYERKIINRSNKEIYFCYGDDVESPFEEYFYS